MYYLYRIFFHINLKRYIGQTVDARKRWDQHIRESKKENPSMVVNRAMKKHCFTDGYFDPTKCTFEIIACCLTQKDTDELEDYLIDQENSHVSNNMGYNVARGGSTSPKTDEWKKKMKNWHASLSPEEKEQRNQVLRQATLNQIATKGHPGQGKKRTPEQIENLKKARAEHPIEYTPEMRQKMSESHIGKQQSEELVQKRIASLKLTCEKRTAELTASGELKCNAPDCDVIGRAEYYIVDGIRYCQMHGQRVKRHGNCETVMPAFAPNKGKILSEEERQKLKGRIPHNKGKKGPPVSEETREKLRGNNPPNKVFIEDEKVMIILASSLSVYRLSKEIQVTRTIIKRIRQEYQTIEEYREDRVKSEEQKQKREQIIPLHLAGMSQQEIIAQLHVDNRAVTKILREYHLNKPTSP